MTVTSSETAGTTAYSMVLRWDPVDSIYVVDVPELPECHTHGRTRAEAVAQGQEAIEAWLAAARTGGRPIPAPCVWTDDDEQPVAAPAIHRSGREI
jgi:predicted RNase H-like HicB family nuclease